MVWLNIVLNRLVWLVPTLLGLLAIVFVLSRVVPIDPARLAAGDNASPEQVAAVRHSLGFDRPLPEQFLRYVAAVARGDFGTSLFTQQPIADDLAARLPATLELTLVAIVLAAAIGIPLGVLAAVRRGSLAGCGAIPGWTMCCAWSPSRASPWPRSGSPCSCSSCSR